MKKQLLKQVCGLCIGVAGALAPIVSVQAGDEYADRYVNGYLNDPQTNEVAADTKSVLKPDAQATKTSGAQGPVRETPAALETKPMDKKQIEREWFDRYSNGA